VGPRSRGLLLAGVVLALLSFAALYLAWTALRVHTKSGGSKLAAAQEQRHVLFENLGGQAGSPTYGRVALAPLDQPTKRVLTGAVCERVYYSAGRGLCLEPNQGASRDEFIAKVLDARFHVRHTLSLEGIPSRARVSPNGRFGATTGFVSGHSYAKNDFSTITVLIDMSTGKQVANLEHDFSVTRNGKPFIRRDFNFWGVTFARDGRHFYATLASRDRTYLVRGDMPSRTAQVLHGNVECPSLSPDERRVAYKKKVGDETGVWRLHVLDLETMKDTALAETRPVDDQVEWLDDGRVLYGYGADTWSVPADGGGRPKVFLSKALSPAVVDD
jgi:hypothetical protein